MLLARPFYARAGWHGDRELRACLCASGRNRPAFLVWNASASQNPVLDSTLHIMRILVLTPGLAAGGFIARGGDGLITGPNLRGPGPTHAGKPSALDEHLSNVRVVHHPTKNGCIWLSCARYSIVYGSRPRRKQVEYYHSPISEIKKRLFKRRMV
jgi:hypothetical protein